jgi:enterochelin esterase-like enzyme
LNTGFRYWDLFGSVGLHSTPPFINDSYRLRDWLLAIPEGQQPRLWLDTGKLDWYLKITTDFEALLVAQNVPHEWYLFNGTHDEAYWSAHVGDYLSWYSLPWQERFPYLP